MKILWISHLLPYPPKGGVRIRSYNLLRETSKYNEIHFVGLTQKAHQKDTTETNQGIQELERFCKSVRVHPFESYSSRFSWYILAMKSFFSNTAYKQNWCRSNELAKSLREVIEKERINVTHFDTISLLQYAKFLPQNMPVVMNHHNIESQMMHRRAKNEKNLLKKVLFYREATKLRKLEIQYCGRGMNLVVSELDENRLREINRSWKIEVIPNGVDTNYFKRLSVPNIKNSLIFVGGLTWYPNADAVEYFCQEIWPLIKKKRESAKVFIVGRNPSDRLKNLVKNEENINFLGFIEDVRPLMSSATAYFCPMRDGGGTRLKVLDALAMGVPLVATSMACEGIPVEDGKHVLIAESSEEFADKVIMLLKDKKLRERLAKESRRLIEDHFDYEKIGEKLNHVYLRATSD